ncbi:YkvA family protein [Clostridium subterminale]|uniref:YkvA family protein n=1 Tax=Clostridium subterminale TaxID=1550 RepID=A0ABP3W8U0_CLOSU
MIEKIKYWAKKLKTYIDILYLVYKNRRTPWYAKVVVAITVGYAFSPIDLIPDFIPIFGFLDDVILLPVLIWLSLKLIPKEVIESCKLEAENIFKEGRPKNYIVGGIIILIWILIALIIINKSLL